MYFNRSLHHKHENPDLLASRTDIAGRVPDPMAQNGSFDVEPWAATSYK